MRILADIIRIYGQRYAYMPRISIYIPDDMKARMDKASDDVSWSAVAQRAFSVELDFVESVKEIKTMSDVIERLRTSKQRFAQNELSRAREAGVEWAKKRAQFNELRQIARFDTVGLDMLSGEEAAAYVVNFVIGGDHFDESDLAYFFGIDEDALDSITPEYVEGFVEGAVAVWEEVEDEI